MERVRLIITNIKKKKHMCYHACDPSHKAWNDNFPDDSILKGECIHHINGIHEDNRPKNMQKMTISSHISLHNTGRFISEKTKRKISDTLSGKNHPMYGRKHTKETKEKMSKNHADYSGKNHPRYGIKHTKETIKKMSEVKKGKILSDGHRKKLSEAHIGIKHTEKTKKKISKALSGRKLSEETKRKISIAHIKFHTNTFVVKK